MDWYYEGREVLKGIRGGRGILYLWKEEQRRHSETVRRISQVETLQKGLGGACLGRLSPKGRETEYWVHGRI